MARDGKPTRDKILAESEALVLQNGFAGTSIDMILDKTGITKGAFFYHFKTKNILATALIEKFAEQDMMHMERALKETERFKEDPLDRLLQFMQFFIDEMTGIKESPGCLYASYTNESNQFDAEIKQRISNSILTWRKTMEQLINNVLEKYNMVIETDPQSLADLFNVVFEGGFVLSRALHEPELIAKQLMHLKNHFQLLFEPKK